jgi:hypothetical protein
MGKPQRYRPHSNENLSKSKLESVKEMNASQSFDAAVISKRTTSCDDDYSNTMINNRKMQHITPRTTKMKTTMPFQPQCKTSEGRTIYTQQSGFGGVPKTRLKYSKKDLVR